MDIFEQAETLNSMRILVDTREQDTQRSRQRYSSFGVPFDRVPLKFGDYTWQCTIHGRPFFSEGSVTPLIAIERKMDLDELAQCLTRSRDRFRREFERAKATGARIILLIENGSWDDLNDSNYRTRMNAHAFRSSLIAWIVRYNLNLIFCRERDSGMMIKEILYRDLKERLERGEFDEVDRMDQALEGRG